MPRPARSHSPRPSPGASHVAPAAVLSGWGEGNRKGLAEADKPAEREGEALLGVVARAGLEGLAIKGWR